MTFLTFAARRLVRQSHAASAFSSSFARSFASVGDKLPSVDLHKGFPPEKINLAEFGKDKSIILLGLPGTYVFSLDFVVLALLLKTISLDVSYSPMYSLSTTLLLIHY